MPDVNLNAAELEASFRRALEAFNKADWKTFRENVADGCVYEEVATQERFDGADTYIDRVKQWKAGFPDMAGTIDSLTIAGMTGIAELRWKGTHTGTLQTQMGPVPPTNKVIDTRAVMIVENDGTGKAIAIRHYTNPYLMMTQLGLMPATQAMST